MTPSEQSLRDIETCKSLASSIIKERDDLRAPQVLWEVRSEDDGGVMDRFVAPASWAPGELIQRFELSNNARLFRIGQVPRLATDETVKAYLKRQR
jgi:hypothetical protein